jgi:hypothetical protein
MRCDVAAWCPTHFPIEGLLFAGRGGQDGACASPWEPLDGVGNDGHRSFTLSQRLAAVKKNLLQNQVVMLHVRWRTYMDLL